MEYVTLHNGVKMPMLGYGVYQVDPAETERCVLEAIETGYRSIDTAQAYGNEEGVGRAAARCGLPREELFLTTKVWITNGGYEKAKASIEDSLNKLQTNYVDLLLIHQPFNDYYGTYRAMEEACRAGKARAIGVSNFYPDRMVDLASFARIRPMVNQVEVHPYHQQQAAKQWHDKYGLQTEAWAPFGEGRGGVFTDPVLLELGEKYGKTAAQVILRWHLQRGIVVIPKSVHPQRMAENFDVFDFTLSREDMDRVAALDKGQSAFFSHTDPNMVEWFGKMVEERKRQQDCARETKNW